MKVIPLNGFVMVKDIPPPEKEGMILVPANKTKPIQMGAVIAQGPGWAQENGSLLEPGCSVDDVVCFGRHAGAVVRIDGEDFRFVPCQEILAIVEDV